MTDRLIGVFGASGCGRGIMPLVRDMAVARGARLAFIDDAPLGPEINGQPLMSLDAFAADPAHDKHVALAIANGRIRATLADRCAALGLPLLTVRAANVIEMDDVAIGEGALLSPFVTLTSNIRIGRGFHANLYAYVEHDCVIGDFVTFAPGVHCNGDVHIGDFAYVGAGALLRQGVRIGAGATIGMGAVVIRDVSAGATVVGNPARPMRKT